MKKILLKTISLLMMALAPLAMPAVNTIIHTVTYDFSQMSTGTDTLGGVTYTTVNYAGLYNNGAPGTPSLPVDYLRFSVPWNATNFSVTTSVRNNVITNLKYLVYPCQPHWLMDDTTQHPVTSPDSSAYYSGSQYPTQRAWIVDEGFLAGENHIVTVAVMPVSFINSGTGPATTRQLIKSRTVTLTLHYDLSDSLAMYPIVRQDTVLRQEGYRLAQSMVVNPNNVAAYAPMDVIQDTIGIINPNSGGDGLNGGGLNPPDPGDISNDSISGPPEDHYIAGDKTYLIVTTADLYHSTRRIAALKRQEGYDVSVVTMDEVLNSPYSLDGDRIEQEGGTYKLTYTDDAGKLRQYLRYAYRFCGTKYVLLVGNGVPYREITMYPYGSMKTFQSDLYFSDLSADWSNDTIEKSPELFVGRIIAKNKEQIDNYTDKAFRYELNPGKGDYSYLKRAFYSQGYDMRFFHEIDTIRTVLDSIYSTPFIMQETDTIDKPISFPSGRDIIDELNNTRYSFISLHHHGFPSSLLTCGLRNGHHKSAYRFLWAIDTASIAETGWVGDDNLTNNGLNNLTNKDYPIVCYSIACKTMPFKLPTYYIENGLKMCFGESFITGKDYGGPIFIGNTNSGITLSSALLEKSVANELLKGYYKMGEANGYGKNLFCTFDKKLTDYVSAVQNILGDPSIELWTEIPQSYSNISITRSNNSISISGINADSTIIAFIDNDGHKRIITDSLNLTEYFSPNSSIMLYKHNYIPYIAPLVLQKVDLNRSQYVIASDVTAGRAVDSGRTHGDVTVKSGIEYEIEASGTVTLEGGFNVEKGATFAVYPSCF